MFDTDAFNSRLFYPRRDVTDPPPGAVDVNVVVDGAVLHLRMHAPGAARATLLLFHGNGEVVADYDDAAEMFARAGAALAVVDFRGYGRSSGTPTLRDAIHDAAPSLDAVAARTTLPIVVMGRSLGSSCAQELYGQGRRDVAGYVLESGFTDLGALVDRRGLPRRIDPADVAFFDPLVKLRRGAHPLLVLHGERDELIVADEARAAHAQAGAADADKELVLVPGRGHNDLSSSPVYWDALRDFIARCA